jgi:hypothetical protein
MPIEQYPNQDKSIIYGRYEVVGNKTPPSLYSILTCLTKSCPEDFETFCGEFGYNTNSRKALDTYVAVQKEWAGVQRLFGDCLEELREIQ